MHTDNRDNLIPMNQRSREEAVKNGRKGGKASGAARRRKRILSETINTAWNSKIEVTEKTAQSLRTIGYEIKKRGDPTAMDMIVASITVRAINGDLAAFEMLARYGLMPDMKAELELQRLEVQRKDAEQRKGYTLPENNLVETLLDNLSKIDQNDIPELKDQLTVE